MNRFVTDPDHDTTNVVGYIQSDELGGQLPVEKGLFNLSVDDADPSVKKMFYRLFFTDGNGQPMTLSGHKLSRTIPASTCGTTRPRSIRVFCGAM